MFDIKYIYQILLGDCMIDYFLRASLERNKTICIMYLKGNEITKRNIKVLNIDNENIKAFCFLRNQKRIFKIENILSASFIYGNYERTAK
jgi:predicted DNA-binding transcriptional regulator YafY